MKCKCANAISPARVKLGYTLCMPCGEVEASKRKHTIVPMHKSNYMVITDRRDLMGINNDGY